MIERNITRKNPNWLETNQLVGYLQAWSRRPGTTDYKSSQWLGRGLGLQVHRCNRPGPVKYVIWNFSSSLFHCSESKTWYLTTIQELKQRHSNSLCQSETFHQAKYQTSGCYLGRLGSQNSQILFMNRLQWQL